MNAEELILDDVGLPAQTDTGDTPGETVGTAEVPVYVPDETPEHETQETVGTDPGQSNVDYTSVYYDASSSICAVLLFCAFAVCGMLSAIQIFGGVKR